MFTTILLLLLSFPLDATFKRDGRKSFVKSLIFYSVNISLVSIAYGYKVWIMLFQKERNTKEAFEKIRMKCINSMLTKPIKHSRETKDMEVRKSSKTKCINNE